MDYKDEILVEANYQNEHSFNEMEENEVLTKYDYLYDGFKRFYENNDFINFQLTHIKLFELISAFPSNKNILNHIINSNILEWLIFRIFDNNDLSYVDVLLAVWVALMNCSYPTVTQYLYEFVSKPDSPDIFSIINELLGSSNDSVIISCIVIMCQIILDSEALDIDPPFSIDFDALKRTFENIPSTANNIITISSVIIKRTKIQTELCKMILASQSFIIDKTNYSNLIDAYSYVLENDPSIYYTINMGDFLLNKIIYLVIQKNHQNKKSIFNLINTCLKVADYPSICQILNNINYDEIVKSSIAGDQEERAICLNILIKAIPTRSWILEMLYDGNIVSSLTSGINKGIFKLKMASIEMATLLLTVTHQNEHKEQLMNLLTPNFTSQLASVIDSDNEFQWKLGIKALAVLFQWCQNQLLAEPVIEIYDSGITDRIDELEENMLLSDDVLSNIYIIKSIYKSAVGAEG